MPGIRRRTLQQQGAVILITALAFLTPAALASPADPTWISGIYDDGDYDDVILLVASTSSTPVERNDRGIQLELSPAGPKPNPQTGHDARAARLAFEGRAPPIA